MSKPRTIYLRADRHLDPSDKEDFPDFFVLQSILIGSESLVRGKDLVYALESNFTRRMESFDGTIPGFISSIKDDFCFILVFKGVVYFYRSKFLPLYFGYENGKCIVVSNDMILVHKYFRNVELLFPGNLYSFNTVTYELRLLNTETITCLSLNLNERVMVSIFESAVDEILSKVNDFTILISGIDSYILTYFVSKRVKKFPCIFLKNGGYDPGKFIEKINTLHDAEITLKYLEVPTFTENDVKKIVEIIVDEEPTLVNSALLLNELYKECTTSAILTGDGVDEIIGGYEIFKDIPPHIAREMCQNLVLDFPKNIGKISYRLSMNVGKRVISPFTNKTLVEYVININPRYKTGKEKSVIKKCFNFVPEISDMEQRLITEGFSTGLESKYPDYFQEEYPEGNLLLDI